MPDGGPGECACPTGFECIQLFTPWSPPKWYDGSYCVKTGTVYNAALTGAWCQPGDAGALPCGNYDGT
jgi:hypothetical protein